MSLWLHTILAFMLAALAKEIRVVAAVEFDIDETMNNHVTEVDVNSASGDTVDATIDTTGGRPTNSSGRQHRSKKRQRCFLEVPRSDWIAHHPLWRWHRMVLILGMPACDSLHSILVGERLGVAHSCKLWCMHGRVFPLVDPTGSGDGQYFGAIGCFASVSRRTWFLHTLSLEADFSLGSESCHLHLRRLHKLRKQDCIAGSVAAGLHCISVDVLICIALS